MPAELTIPDHYQVKYGDMWESRLQNSKNRLAQHVTMVANCTGKYKTIEQIDPLELDEKTTRFGKTELTEPGTRRRIITPRAFDKAVGFDEDDGWKLGAIEVPVMPAARELFNGAQRAMQRITIEGINGVNKVFDVDSSGVETIVDVSLTNEVAVNYVETGSAANSNLTVGKIRAALEILQDSEAFGQDVDEDQGQAVMAVTSKQLHSLLRATEITSKDYAEVKALVNGKIDEFCGFKFLRLPKSAMPITNNTRSVLAWVKSCVAFGVWDGFKSKLSIRDDLSEATQYRVKFAAGATRKQEEGVVRILCDETVL